MADSRVVTNKKDSLVDTTSDALFDIESIYTPIEEAKEEIWRRWNDKELRAKVEAVLGEVPEVFKDGPKASLARCVTSPNFEASYFLESARKNGLNPLFLEYYQDKFVSKNIDKYYLGKLYFYNELGKNPINRLSFLKITDIKEADGKLFSQLHTSTGESLIDFHHHILHETISESKGKHVDVSDFLKKGGYTAKEYYAKFFSLFICHGVLFENYLLDEFQIKFTRNIALKNFEEVTKLFGVKPIIVRLGPPGREDDLYWRYYPESIKSTVLAALNQEKKGKPSLEVPEQQIIVQSTEKKTTLAGNYA